MDGGSNPVPRLTDAKFGLMELTYTVSRLHALGARGPLKLAAGRKAPLFIFLNSRRDSILQRSTLCNSLQTRISQPRIGVQRSGLAHRNRGKFVRPVSIRPTPDGQPEAPENATFLQKHARFHLFSGSATSPPAPTAGYVPDRTVRCPGRVPGSSGKARQGLQMLCQPPNSSHLCLT